MSEGLRELTASVRGERTASAMEAHLSTLESKIDSLLAAIGEGPSQSSQSATDGTTETTEEKKNGESSNKPQ